MTNLTNKTDFDLSQFDSKEKLASSKSIGLVIGSLIGAGALGLTVVCFPFVLPAFRKICLPYVPATTRQVSNVMSALKKRKGSVMDLGSGDGKLVIEAAKHGFSSYGVELNPWLVAYSRYKSFITGTRKQTNFYCKDMWKVDLGCYNNIIIFGVDEMMPLLEQKLSVELKKGSCIIACRFPLPNWNPVDVISEGIDTVWVYEKNN